MTCQQAYLQRKAQEDAAANTKALKAEVQRLQHELQRRSFAHGNVKLAWGEKEARLRGHIRKLEAENRKLEAAGSELVAEVDDLGAQLAALEE